jgi:hypothetical protein
MFEGSIRYTRPGRFTAVTVSFTLRMANPTTRTMMMSQIRFLRSHMVASVSGGAPPVPGGTAGE